MGDARTGPMQSGQTATPSATSVGRGSAGGSMTMNSSDVNNGMALNTANEVPGFGTNSSIHELFGKMVWKKMEGLRDEAVIDRLQNRIMNMIHEALAQQSDSPAYYILWGCTHTFVYMHVQTNARLYIRTMAQVEPECTSQLKSEIPETTDSAHPVPGSYYNGTSQAKRPQPTKVFFAPQKYGFFTMNKVEQRWLFTSSLFYREMTPRKTKKLTLMILSQMLQVI
ncbi:hypothetical protein DICVIV_02890 [Dictyocaulus viviparus]|uniref:Uncharacterized protein n=1 Tax=Dictyocaulus viviparus TaxID=29172 RepID=A0A0D8Y4K0_DICVI|nr:hypothetical protein DICVIV_02890 [Dictyocaulus viviparus]